MLLRAVLLLALCLAASAFTVPHRAVSPCRARAPLLGLRAASDDSAPPNPVAADAPAYAASLAVQGMPLALDDRLSHYVFFLSLATLTVYLGARARHRAAEAPTSRCASAARARLLVGLARRAVLLHHRARLDLSFVYRAFEPRARARRLPVAACWRSASPTPTPPAPRASRARAALRPRPSARTTSWRAWAAGVRPVAGGANFSRALALARSARCCCARSASARCCSAGSSATTCTSSSSATHAQWPRRRRDQVVASTRRARRQAISPRRRRAPGLLVGVLARYGAAAGGAARSPPRRPRERPPPSRLRPRLAATFSRREHPPRRARAALPRPAVVGAGVATRSTAGGRARGAARHRAPTEASPDAGA